MFVAFLYSLSIYIVGFPGRGNLLKSDAVIFKSAQKIFMFFYRWRPAQVPARLSIRTD